MRTHKPQKDHDDRINTLVNHLKKYKSVAVEKKHVPDVKAKLSSADKPLAHFTSHTGRGKSYEAGILTLDEVED